MSKKIVILDSRYISAFRTHGPIVRPTVCDDAVIKNVVLEGHVVFERTSDGSSVRITEKDFEPKPVAKKSTPKPAPVEVKTEVVVEETPIASGNVFNGVSETSAPVMPEPEKKEEAPATLTKAQRRAQKKAKLEAAKAEEAAAETPATEEVAE